MALIYRRPSLRLRGSWKITNLLNTKNYILYILRFVPCPPGSHQKQTPYCTSKPRKSWFFKHFFIDNNYRLSYYRPSIWPSFPPYSQAQLTVCFSEVKVGRVKRFLPNREQFLSQVPGLIWPYNKRQVVSENICLKNMQVQQSCFSWPWA